LGPLERPVAARLAELAAGSVIERIWSKDPTVWGGTPATPELADRLGWLVLPERAPVELAAIADFQSEVRRAFRHVVLCGMGGSSLAPDVLSRASGAAPGGLRFHMLDSTHPDAIAAVDRVCAPRDTLYIIASKSGTTIETSSFFSHYWAATGGRGSHFTAITDPGTVLNRLALERGVRRVWLAPPDVGGRYSALSVFGLVPGALAGADLSTMAASGTAMAGACREARPDQNPGAWLGAVLGEAARIGRDKLTILEAAGTGRFGLWVEQLVAESTGKKGLGIAPVVEEPLGGPEGYGDDRIFVRLATPAPADPEDHLITALERAGHPVVRITLRGAGDLGGEFFRWEFATAVACAILGVNPFDQPNVAESKANTAALLRQGLAPQRTANGAEVSRLLRGTEPGEYIALLAYLPDMEGHTERLRAIAGRWRDRLRRPVAVGYGPRYLHSTGQLHKGGRAAGRFVFVVPSIGTDCPVPGATFTFGTLMSAQAQGDIAALGARGRPVVQVDSLDALDEVTLP
jgi:glucose-6-phosphate isomerase